MAIVKNQYSFLLSTDDSYILYYKNKPVLDQISDCTITASTSTNSSGVVTYSYHFNDQKLFEYFNNKVQKTRSKTARLLSRTTDDKTVNVTSDNPAAKNDLDQATKASQQSATTNAPLMNTVRDGFGAMPNKDKVDSLTNNTGAYGGGIGSLVYPSDLITNTYGYNGCYTVFFISENQGTSAAGKMETLKVGTKYNNTAEDGAIAGQMKNVGSETYEKGVSTIAGGLAGFTMFKAGANSTEKLIKGAKSLISGSTGMPSASGGLVASAATDVIGVGLGGCAGWFDGKNANELSVFQDNSQYVQLNVAIALPTPRIEDKHTLRWEEKEATLAGGLLQMLQGANHADPSKLFSLTGAYDELKRVANLTDERGDKISDTATANAKGALEAFTLSTVANKAINPALSVIAGRKVNPRKEQLFNDVGWRTFTMQFDLAARSAKDMENIESIIRVFKYHAYPELTPGNYMWIYPAHFDIVHYYRNEVNYHMPRHATSVLTNIDVDYSGGQNFISVHHDGSPVLIKLTLTFAEIAILNRDSIAKGY